MPSFPYVFSHSCLICPGSRPDFCEVLQIIGTMEHALTHSPPYSTDIVSSAARTQMVQPRSTETLQSSKLKAFPAYLPWKTCSYLPEGFHSITPVNEQYLGNRQLTCSYNTFDCRGSCSAGAARIGWLPTGLGSCCSESGCCCSGA